MPDRISQSDRAVVDTVAQWCLLVVYLVGWASAGHTDTDVWGHATIGRWILDHRTFLWVDPFSFTHDQPWINHEWLWDVTTAFVERLAGLPGLVALRAALIGIVLWRINEASRGRPFGVRAVALILVTVACVAQWQSTRPQIATLAFYAITLESLAAWWLPALFLVWANTHGGWIYGAGLVGLYTLVHASRRQLTIAAYCALATLVNPYGWRLWLALVDAMQRGWADVGEWAPIWNVDAGAGPLVLWLLCAVLAVWAAAIVRLPRWQWVWIAVTFGAAANSRRLEAMAVLTATMFILHAWPGQQVAITWTAARRWTAAGLLALAGSAAVALASPLKTCWAPLPGVTGPEPEAAAFARSSGLRGRALVYFDYGLYVVAHLHDRMQVSIDNRRETVYSDAILQGHQRFNRGDDPTYPDRLGADVVWLPATLGSVISDLEKRGWHRRFAGPRTVLLSREEGPTLFVGSAGEPCYPR